MRVRTLFFLLLAAFAVQAPAWAQVDWSQRPEVGPPPIPQLPEIQQFTLQNGLEVYFVEKRDIPVAQFRVMIPAGSVHDPAGKFGLASVTADMLDEGAGSRDAIAFSDEVSFLGASLSVGAGLHMTQASLSTPASQMDAALALMADMLLRPTLEADDFERIKRQRLVGFSQQRAQARALASVASDRMLYGANHPYGRQTSGDSTSVANLTLADIQGFFQRHISPRGAKVVAVGDFSRADLERLLTTHLGSWQGQNPVAVTLPPAQQVEGRRIVLIHREGSAQSTIRVVRLGVSRTTPDYYALEVLNTILGGSFTSRLMQNLRERNGFTYGAGSAFVYRPENGPFLATSDVQKEFTARAVQEFLNELTAITEPIPTEEAERGRNNVALSFPQSFTTSGGMAAMIGDLVANGLPLDTYQSFVQNILAITPQTLQAAAQRHIDPNNVMIFIVGDANQVEPQLREAGWDAITRLTIEEALGL